MKSLLFILFSLTYSLCTWLISEQNLLQGFSGTDGWNVTGSYCSDNRDVCNGRDTLGGYSCFGAGSKASRWFNIAHHWKVRIQITFWMIDSWDSELLQVIIAGESFYDTRNLVDGSNFCGAGWNDGVKYLDLTKTDHYERDILVQFSSTLDQNPLDESWGISDFIISVEPCNPTCNQCSGQDAFMCKNCWANADFIPYLGGLGFCKCKTGYYTVSKDVPCKDPTCSECILCNSTCETCSGGDKYSCVKCKSNLYKQYYGAIEVNYNYSDPRYQKTECVSSCIAANYYMDPINRECVRCFDTCKTCSSSLEYECLSCYNGYYLDGSTSGKCVTSCNSNYYKDNTDKKCKKCNSNCLECLDDQPNFCSKCKNGSYLTIGTGVCVLDCGVGQWERTNDWTCQYCDSTCYNCDINATKCTQCSGIRYLYDNQCLTVCPDGYYKGASNTCQPCDSSCKTCDQGSNTDCLSCSPSYGYLKDRQCIQCPNQFYGDQSDQKCKPCDTSCFNCEAGTSTDCVSCTTNTSAENVYLEEKQCKRVCKDGYWGNDATHTCDNCDSNCKTCQLYGPNVDCLSCSSPLFLKNLRCISACNPIGEYGDTTTRECTPCNGDCYKCNQKNSNNCTECTGLRYFYNNQCLLNCPGPSHYGLNNVCVTSCPDGMYADDTTRLCLPCDPICPTCFQSGTTNCNSCASPYYLEGSNCQTYCPSNKYKNSSNRQCNLCHPECLECDGGSKSDCTKCDPARYFGSKVCYVSCLDPYFSSTTTMECVLTCPKGYWGDVNDPSRLCQLCHPRCEECFGPSFSQCTKCKGDNYLFKTSCDNCPVGYFPNTGTKVCDLCFSTCKSCDGPSSSNCLSCNSGRYYIASQKRCYDVCPIPYFSDSSQPDCLLTCPSNQQFGNPLTRRCEGCNVACNQCTGASNLDCKSCSSTYYSYDKDKSCLSKCPEGTYADNFTMKCQPCDKSCATCNGGLKSNCLSCLLPNVLYDNQCIYDCPSPLYKDEDLKECVSDCTKKYPNKYADEKERKCKYCHKYCTKCTGALSTQCQKCKYPYLKYDNACLETCISGTYYDSKKANEADNDCKKCNSDCIECYGSSNTNCLSCATSLYSLIENDSLKCLTNCPDQYVKNTENKTCQACPTRTYFYQGECKQCHYTCESCIGSFENQCSKCQETRGKNSSLQPIQGVCSCQTDYVESYKEKCDEAPSAVVGATVTTEVFAIAGSSASSLIGIIGRNMFFLYNMLEISQFTSYFRYINIKFPVSLDKLFDKLYISHISTFSNINSDSNNSPSTNTTSSTRILEDTTYNNSNFLFDLRGKNFPLWKSFFFLIILNVISWVIVGVLNLLASFWKIKYNQYHLIEKFRCWTSYGLPIQMFLRTSMEAILFIVLCFKGGSDVGAQDWIVCVYLLATLIAVLVIMIYQNKQPLKLDEYEEPYILIKKVKVNKVSQETNTVDSKSQTYPHPFRTLWEFTKKDRISRNFYLFYLIQKILLVIFVVQFVSSPDKQILSFAVIKTALFILMLVLRPMINKWYNGVTILNEFLQAIICYLTYACTISSEDDQNRLGYAILILILILFLVNLVGTIISLIFIVKNLILSIIRKNKTVQTQEKTSTLKPSRIQILNKSQKLDLSYQQDESHMKKDSFNVIIDNSSTVQIQKDNQDDFDQSKSNQNQSMYNYDYDNPFGFLERDQQDEVEAQKERKNKKAKGFSKQKLQPLQRTCEQDDLEKIKGMYDEQGNKAKGNDQVRVTDDFAMDNNYNKNQEVIPVRLESDQNNNRISRVASPLRINQQNYREGANQHADDLSDYVYHQNASATPATQFISNSPIPQHMPITPIPQNDSANPSPLMQSYLSSPIPQQFNTFLNHQEKIDDFEESQSKEIKDMNGNGNKMKLSQLQIKLNKVENKQDDHNIEQIVLQGEGKQEEQNQQNIISFLNDLTLNKIKKTKMNQKKIIRF